MGRVLTLKIKKQGSWYEGHFDVFESPPVLPCFTTGARIASALPMGQVNYVNSIKKQGSWYGGPQFRRCS